MNLRRMEDCKKKKEIDRTFRVCCSCPNRVSFNPPSTEHIMNKEKENNIETRTILIFVKKNHETRYEKR